MPRLAAFAKASAAEHPSGPGVALAEPGSGHPVRRGLSWSKLGYTFQTAGERPPSRGACRPSFTSRIALAKTRAQGRPGAGWHPQVRALQKCTRGGPQVSPDRPAFPARMVLTVSFVLSPGSDALLPPSPCGWLMRASGRTATSLQDLTHRPRASGPHDFSVRARLRWDSEGWRVLAPEAMRRRCRRRVVGAKAIAHGESRPAMPVTPDAVTSIAARPAVRDDRDPPLVSGQGVSCVR
ncbi:hypothetical protein AB7M17_006816 [Bradyrhizobium sp. USDA 377]